MITLSVPLGERAYPLYLAENLLSNAALFKEILRGRPFLIISNQTLSAYAEALSITLQGLPEQCLLLPDGEQYKNINTLTVILEHLTAQHFSRQSVLIALGGGVVGDIVGFAAAVYQRGIAFIQVPTSLLAMVDSSIGGKTAVNVGQAKNNVGAFHQPDAVVMDMQVLNTLPEREYHAGLAEVIKHALIQDQSFFDWLCVHQLDIAQRNLNVVMQMIQRSCEIKARIVALDEKETDLRMLLNFGHTFGHAIEAYSHYKDFKHGEAVALGMLCALKWRGQTDLMQRLKKLYQAWSLPIEIPADYDPQRLFELMQHDKKKSATAMRLILLDDIGQAVIHEETDLAKLQRFWS
jgi:3-dehydroquinate synthase